MAKYLDEGGLTILWNQIKEKFYSINDLGLDYDEGTKTIKLKGKDGSYIGNGISAAPFIKDGMLNDVFVINVTGDAESGFYYDPDGEGEPVRIEHDEVTEPGKYILFQWNTDAGDDKIDIIKTSDIGATYSGSDSIAISGSNQLSVIDVKADLTTTKEDIPVAGGPLAELVKGTFKDGKIAKGTDLQELLVSLFAKEEYPKPSVTPGRLTSAFAQPNVTINKSGTVEVGTPVTVGVFTGYEAGKTSTARKYTGFTYGWSLADDGSADAQGNPTDVNVTEVTVKSGEYTVKRTYTGFGKDSTPTTVSNAVASQAIISEDSSPVVAEGSNSVKFEISGPGYTGKVVSSPLYYVVSNFGKTSAEHTVAAQDEQSLDVNATSASRTYTITGAYKYFFGTVDFIDLGSFSSEIVRALPTSGIFDTTEKIVVTTFDIPAKKAAALAIPEGYRITNIENAFGVVSPELAKKQGSLDITLPDNSTTKSYDIYTIDNLGGSSPAGIKNLKISK